MGVCVSSTHLQKRKRYTDRATRETAKTTPAPGSAFPSVCPFFFPSSLPALLLSAPLLLRLFRWASCSFCFCLPSFSSVALVSCLLCLPSPPYPAVCLSFFSSHCPSSLSRQQRQRGWGPDWARGSIGQPWVRHPLSRRVVWHSCSCYPSWLSLCCHGLHALQRYVALAFCFSFLDLSEALSFSFFSLFSLSSLSCSLCLSLSSLSPCFSSP